MKEIESHFTIAAVERELGLSKDVLRAWERRYGFPVPGRNERGERAYPAEQVLRLRLVKRLMDRGHRPGRLLPLPPAELRALSDALAASRTDASLPAAGSDEGAERHPPLLDLLRAHQPEALAEALQRALLDQGLGNFVQDTIDPLAQQVGSAWEEGALSIFEEHLFTEVAGRLLRQAIGTVPSGRGPRVLLTTLPDEQHGLALLMVEAILVLAGARCVALGTQTPMLEIVQAAQAHRADVVALSFSASFPPRQVPMLLRQLRQSLPPATQLWAGGAGVARVPELPGVRLLTSLTEAAQALAPVPAT